MSGNSAMIGATTRPAQAHNHPDARGYQAAHEVNVRAATSTSGDTPHTRQAIAKLNRQLESGAPPNRDVPRGYYLDLKT